MIGESEPRPARIALIGEYHIGHITFMDSLRAAAERNPAVEPMWLPVRPGAAHRWKRLPGAANWTIEASLRARDEARRAQRNPGVDAILLHTQTIAAASVGLMRRIPTWISTDGTPVNMDELAAAYDHRIGPAGVERLKRLVTGRALRAAAGVICWSNWVARSVVDDYDVPENRIVVIPPGAKPIVPAERSRAAGLAVRLLFVGGDFTRKGGADLLAAAEGMTGIRLDVVTRSDVPARSGLHVHRGLTPNHPLLQQLYAEADIAVLPTYGDTTGHALLEAMAARLPVVSTRIGAIPEVVAHGENGLLIEPGDVQALHSALQTLVNDGALRTKMAAASWERARTKFDAETNADRILNLCAHGWH